MKLGNFACIKIRILCIIGSIGYYNVIFEAYIFSRIFKKRELRENMYSAKICTFTVLPQTMQNGGVSCSGYKPSQCGEGG